MHAPVLPTELTLAETGSLKPTIAEPDWASRGLCIGKTNLFFAPPGERSTRRANRQALAASYCARCPVAVECRQSARDNREAGFWGGESEEQRAAAGFPPRSPNRRLVAELGREAAARQNAAGRQNKVGDDDQRHAC